MKALTVKSRENLDAVMPGYTHLQRAQPTTFAHYMMAYANMLKRDVSCLQDCLRAHGRNAARLGRTGFDHLSDRP